MREEDALAQLGNPLVFVLTGSAACDYAIGIYVAVVTAQYYYNCAATP